MRSPSRLTNMFLILHQWRTQIEARKLLGKYGWKYDSIEAVLKAMTKTEFYKEIEL